MEEDTEHWCQAHGLYFTTVCPVCVLEVRRQVAQEIFEELERVGLIRTEDCGVELWVHEYTLIKDRWLK